MFEESVSTIPSFWASMNSWFTPTVLFVLLNVVIGTIAFTSTLANQKHHHQQSSQNDPQQLQPKIARSPSVLQRLRSINFYSNRSQEPHHLSSHLKPNPDSDANYNLEHSHHQAQSFEAHSQYIFPQIHQEKQAMFYQNPQETQSHYYFEQTHHEKAQENENRFVFEQAGDGQTQENENRFVFEQAGDEKAQEDESHYVFQQTHEEKTQENGTHFDFEQAHKEDVENEDELQSLDEVYNQLRERHVNRSKSDTKPVGGELPVKLPKKMKKSASMKSAFKHFKEEDIVEARRPATVKEGRSKATEVDEEVDAKADDFINRFKQQLKLQRLDSIIRYKEMIGNGSGR